MEELRIYHFFVVYLSEGCVILNLLINSWTLFAVRNFSRTGDTKKVIHFQLLDCTRDEGTAKQIMMHNFAKDESGSFEKVIWIQSQLLKVAEKHWLPWWKILTYLVESAVNFQQFCI